MDWIRKMLLHRMELLYGENKGLIALFWYALLENIVTYKLGTCKTSKVFF
jgi:hypothetical protein